MIPYFIYRLYQTPLVIDQWQATLYLQAGNSKTWQQPSEDLQRFADLIENEANQHPEERYSASTLQNLAVAYRKQNDLENTIKYFEKSLSRLPSDEKTPRLAATIT